MFKAGVLVSNVVPDNSEAAGVNGVPALVVGVDDGARCPLLADWKRETCPQGEAGSGGHVVRPPGIVAGVDLLSSGGCKENRESRGDDASVNVTRDLDCSALRYSQYVPRRRQDAHTGLFSSHFRRC